MQERSAMLYDTAPFKTMARMLEGIEVDPKICKGKPRLQGTEITVEAILNLIADGYDTLDITRMHPELEDVHVRRCARYAVWLIEHPDLAL